jgi:soluble lytic murein transglycosylase-like protein
MLKTKFTIIFIAILSLLSLPSYADIYKYVDKYGRVVLTDKPKHNGYKRLVKTWKGWEEYKVPKNFNWVKNQKKFDSTIRSIAKSYKLPHTLLHAVITAESSYNPDAISKAGAVGLMQLMPETAKQYGVKNRRNPRENIYGGTRYLRYLLKLFNNDIVLALAAYNAGEGTVKRYGNKVPPYKETRNYVNKVIRYYKKYKVSMS